MRNFFLSLPPIGTRARNALRVIAVFLAAVVFVSVYLTAQAIQTQFWQLWVITAAAWSLVVFGGIGFNLSRRGNPELAMWITFVPWLVVLVLSSTMISGLGLVLLVSAFSIITMAAGQALQGRQAAALIILGAVMGVAAIFVDGFSTAERIVLPGFERVIAVLVLVILVLYSYLIFNQFRTFSLGTKMVIWMGLTLITATTILVAYSTYIYRQTEIENLTAIAAATAQNEAELIREQLNVPLITARTMAQSFGAIKDPRNHMSLTREQVNGMLKDVLANNPNFLGTYTLWEPNAFDGMDASYAGTAIHDETGRFIPYWVQDVDGNIHVEALIDYETPGIGDWYLQPRQTKQEVTIAPLIYPIGGKDVTMASFIVPILHGNKFYGIVGVDAPIGFVQSLVDGLNLYGGKSQAVVLSDTGTLIAVQERPEFVNQQAGEVYPDFSEIQPRLAAGESFTVLSPDGEYLRIFSPISIGETGTRWYFSLVIPYTELTAAATTAATRQIAVSSALILPALVLLWVLANQLVRPILSLTDVANAVSKGDLNVTAKVQSEDETGVLARTFNQMISQLREAFGTLEERVAARTRNLELAAEVGRAVSQVRALDVMLKDACELILKEFGLYYVQVYLTDDRQKKLILEAGTGDVGVQLLGRGHNLTLDSGSINGRAAAEKRSVIIPDTSQSPTFRKNPLLPETRGEMAVPLIVADKVVGVLDMQSDQPDVLTDEVLPAFEALAGQLAVAIQNANLLAETEQARAQVEAQARRLVRQGWNEHLDAVHKPEKLGYVFAQNKVEPFTDTDEIKVQEDGNTVAAPITVTGESLGSLVVELDTEAGNEQTSELVNVVARQVAQQIENLRLLESAERYRAEAEEASRRLTREGWKSYLGSKNESLGYMYDLNQVIPAAEDKVNGNAMTLPLKARDETIGKIAVMDMTQQDAEAFNLAAAVAERLSAHIESLRQYDQTHSALAQSEKLFDASSRLTQAADLQELTAVAVKALNVPVINRAIMTSFTYDSEGKLEGLDVIANWWNETGTPVTAVGTHYTSDVVRMIPMFVSATPLFFNDAFTDERVDTATMQLVERLNLHAVAVLPLHVGSQQLGVLMLEGDEPYNFTQEEMRLFVALGPQIATVLENRRQFERAQRQAERESMLNVINQKIQSATSVEAVLQIAARELGHALGAPMTIAQLSLKDSST